ncbi:Efflux pump membrane transporter BepE [Salinivirga cyanobacteriivorans]|uniref:Efflux pump membrane transporter BepE n=1 Tax=Salinivirga cyanobacteriivorans TaxID=1307839 RepID=A0A0S2HZY3_9BACT|nr:Efflux pump membrane transporter BepE [Salinivirga cyanobacteriivorans]
MIRFLVNRPIAVSMVYVAFVLLGVIAIQKIPIALMPDIDVPVITVKVTNPQLDARQTENSVIKPLREKLQQVRGLKDIKSLSENGNGSIEIRLHFETNTDLAFIEVNEKIDRVLGHLSIKVDRPRVVKSSVSDIPVFYLNISAKEDSAVQFTELSNFASNVISRRLEQLEGVALADVSGTVAEQIQIRPKEKQMKALNISFEDIENAILTNHINIGSIVAKEGIYEYNLTFETQINNIEQIQNIWISTPEKKVRLKDIAFINKIVRDREGIITSNNAQAVSIAVVKKAGTRISQMQEELNKLVDQIIQDYPFLKFEKIRDQTRLLNYSLNNLMNTLWLGSILAFIVMLVFIKRWQTPILIGVAIPVSLLISILFFYLFNLSINIISLSGLVLGIGLMIDNTIIVVDNITRYWQEKNPILKACEIGTNEIIRPLLSSVLTTCAIFLPMIYIGGLPGALLLDQALAVTIGLLSSYIVSITLIPVSFKLMHPKNDAKSSIGKVKHAWYHLIYEKLLIKSFRKPVIIGTIVLVLLISGIISYIQIDKKKLPNIRQKELFVEIDWDAPIDVHENKKRSVLLTKLIESHSENTTLYVGKQNYTLNPEENQKSSESKIYVELRNVKDVSLVKQKIKTFFNTNYTNAKYDFKPAESAFSLIFGDQQAPLILEILHAKRSAGLRFSEMKRIGKNLQKQFPFIRQQDILGANYIQIAFKRENLLLYQVPAKMLVRKLKMIFGNYHITNIDDQQWSLPIIISASNSNFYEAIQHSFVINANSESIPLRDLISVSQNQSFNKIIAGENGVYQSMNVMANASNYKAKQQQVSKHFETIKDYLLNWSGSIISNQQMIRQMMIVLLISILLLYFILAAQFESLVLPLIVLIEIPLDIAGALLILYLSGISVNVMSLIGIIVMVGIIVNDSILKIDAINRLNLSGYTLINSIFAGGRIRLRPILMTSLTTIFAMVPFLFMTGIGADLQKSLAVSLIAGMAVGTLVSLFIIPILFYTFKKIASNVKS